MILQELRLHNFGLYRGEQVLNLAPSPTKRAPITLFGGINGGGKTTILDAVQLALYGPRAQCSKRSGRSYDTFLAESIHHGIPDREGAAVAIRFLYASDEGQQTYEIRRTWTVRDGKVRETLHVSKNGERDRWLSDNWNQLVEDLIPLGISQLFFFDAEKIRFLAEDDTCGEALGTAIKALLGLDLAERLIADATVLESRLARGRDGGPADAELAQLESSHAAIDESIRLLKERRASLENDLLLAQKELQRAEEEFSNAGGKHWKQRDARRQHLKKLEDDRAELLIRLRTLAAGELPIALAADMLGRIESQADAEQISRQTAATREVLVQRDAELVDALRSQRVSDRVLKLIQAWQTDDLQQREAPSVPDVFHLSEGGFRLLRHLIVALPELSADAAETIVQFDQVRGQMEETERSLAVAADDEKLQPTLNRIKKTMQAHAALEGEANRMDQEIASLAAQRSVLEQKLSKLRRARIDAEIQNEEGQRMIQLVDRTKHTMRAFLERSTRSKIERLSRYMTESFRYLLRKSSLVERIEIDPATFHIMLYNQAGHPVPKERLSEGEKQIFAIAVLWGLGRASTRPLPTIIDTPMARLDATHREYLIERYFPHASHQVIILSTDTEVDRDSYGRLSSSVSRAYHLRYDESERYTTAEEGYFWSAAATSSAGKAVK